MYSLRYGRRLETTISMYAELVRREPGSAKWRILEAAARVGRAHALAQAMQDRERYIPPAEYYREQQEMRKNIFVLKDIPIPAPPPEPRTRDDNAPFTLSTEAASQRIRTLAAEAVSRLDEAAGLMEKFSPAQQAQMWNEMGWALLVLWRMPRKMVPASWPVKEGKPETPERIAEAIEKAHKLQPQNPLYLQSLSDACILASDIAYPSEKNTVLLHRGREALRKMLTHNRGRAEDWYRLASLEAHGGFAALRRRPENQIKYQEDSQKPPADEIFSPDSIKTLQQAIKKDPSNPLYRYTLAAIYHSGDNREKMVEEVERGSAGRRFSLIGYKFAVPTIYAWIFPNHDEMSVRNLLPLLGGFRSISREENPQLRNRLYPRALNALRGLERKYREALSVPGLPPEESELIQSLYSLCRMTLAVLPPR